MSVLTMIFAQHGVQFFIRLMIYLVLWSLVLIFRVINRKKTQKRMAVRTEYMMAHTEKSADGKYPWEM